MKLLALIAAAGLLAVAIPGAPIHAGCTETADVSFDNSVNGSVLTVTVAAKKKRCGPPSPITSASRVQVFVDQRMGTWKNITGIRADLSSARLPNTVQLPLCPYVDPKATAMRVRVMVTLSEPDPNGFFFSRAKRFTPPVC